MIPASGLTGNRNSTESAIPSPPGHWANGRFYEAPDAEVKKQLDTGAEKTPEGAKYPLQARCANLAKLGFVVFHYDMVGNADSKEKYPEVIGRKRAEAVKAYLVKERGIDEARISVRSAAGRKPADTGTTEAARKKNRR